MVEAKSRTEETWSEARDQRGLDYSGSMEDEENRMNRDIF